MGCNCHNEGLIIQLRNQYGLLRQGLCALVIEAVIASEQAMKSKSDRKLFQTIVRIGVRCEHHSAQDLSNRDNQQCMEASPTPTVHGQGAVEDMTQAHFRATVLFWRVYKKGKEFQVYGKQYFNLAQYFPLLGWFALQHI